MSLERAIGPSRPQLLGANFVDPLPFACLSPMLSGRRLVRMARWESPDDRTGNPRGQGPECRGLSRPHAARRCKGSGEALAGLRLRALREYTEQQKDEQ